MKKFFSLMVIAALSVTMVGCGDKKVEKKEEVKTEKTETTTVPKDAPAPKTP
jgi:predicted small lipoprotein YifL